MNLNGFKKTMIVCFARNFASSLRRESVSNDPNNKIAELHNNVVKKMQVKYDAMVVNTTKLMNKAEVQKADLWKIVKSLNEQLAETRDNWQVDSEAQAEEISTLKSLVTSLKMKVEELELLSAGHEVVNQKCTKCSIMTEDSKTLTKHMQDVHGVKQQKVKCPQCPQLFTDKTMFRKHIKIHKMKQNMLEFYCEVCHMKFKQLEDAKNHNLQPCGNIKKTDVVNNLQEPSSSTKYSEESNTVTKETASNKCNACTKVFKTNENLESHIEQNRTEQKCTYWVHSM